MQLQSRAATSSTRAGTRRLLIGPRRSTHMNPPHDGQLAVSTLESRQRATARHRAAANAIDNVFDAAGLVAEQRNGIAAIAADREADVVATAQSLLEACEELARLLAALRRVADVALEYTTRRHLAGDLGTRPSYLFPASARPAAPTAGGAPPSDQTWGAPDR